MKFVKRHFFARSLFANMLQLYSYTTLINELSAKSYSTLFQYSSLVPCFILTFMMSVRKGHVRGQISMQALCALFIALYLIFPSQQTVFMLAIFGVLNDFIGVVTYPLFIERRCKINLQSEMFLTFNNSDMLGRIVACLAFYIFTSLELLHNVSYLLVPLFIIQFYGLFRILSISEITPESQVVEAKPIQKIKQGFSYIALMPIGRILLALLVWIQLSKFLLEYSFYQEVEATFSSKNDVGAYIGGFNLVNTAASYLFALFINRKGIAKESPSNALLPAPVFILAFGISGFFLNPFYLFSINLFVFLILFRSILKPTSRQLLNIAPANIMNEVAFSLTFITCFTNFIIGTWASALSDRMDSQLSIIISCIFAIAGLIIFLQTDSYYVRNLWKTMKSQFSLADNNITSLSIESQGLTKEEAPAPEKEITPELHVGRIESIYHESYDLKNLRNAFLNHCKSLFSNGTVDDYSLLYKFSPKIVEKVRPLLAEGSQKKNLMEVFDYITNLEEHMQSSSLPVATKEQVRNYFVKQVGSTKFNPNLNKFKQITKLSPRECQDVLELISTPKYSVYEAYIFECINENSIHLSPLLENIFLLDYNESLDLQNILSDLFKHDRTSVQLFLQNHMSLGLHKTSKDGLMHLLFFSELFSKDKNLRKDVQNSIVDLFQSNDEDTKDVYINIHLKVLYKTPYYGMWKSYFSKA